MTPIAHPFRLPAILLVLLGTAGYGQNLSIDGTEYEPAPRAVAASDTAPASRQNPSSRFEGETARHVDSTATFPHHHSDEPLPALRLDTLSFVNDSSRFPLPELEQLQPDSAAVITLDSAVAIVVRGSHDIQLAKARWLASREEAKGAWSVFEPKLVGKYNHQETGLPGPYTEMKEDYKLGVQGALPTATQYDVGMRHANYLHSVTLSEMFMGATLRQPLLKGIWFASPIASIRIAKAQERKSYHEYRGQIAVAIAKLHSAFWDCVYATQLLHFEDESVRIARDLQRDGVQRIATGKISPLDLEKISSELAVRLSRRLDALRSLQDARNQLTSQLSSKSSPWLGAVRLRLTSHWRMDTIPPSGFVPADSFQIWNPDYLAQESEIARLTVSVDGHRDARLPTVDLVGSYGYETTGKTGLIAREEFDHDPQRQISGGIEVEIPLGGNIKETHAVASERLGLRAAQTRLSQIALKCRKDQEDLLHQVSQFLDQSRQQREAVIYHHRELQSEFRKLAAGKSNYHLLYDIEEKLRDAQKKLLEVIRSYQLGVMELQRTRGLLLRDNGLETQIDDEPVLIPKLSEE